MSLKATGLADGRRGDRHRQSENMLLQDSFSVEFIRQQEALWRQTTSSEQQESKPSPVVSTQKSSTPSGNTRNQPDEQVDFGKLLNSESVIEEQRRILEQITQEQEPKIRCSSNSGRELKISEELKHGSDYLLFSDQFPSSITASTTATSLDSLTDSIKSVALIRHQISISSSDSISLNSQFSCSRSIYPLRGSCDIDNKLVASESRSASNGHNFPTTKRQPCSSRMDRVLKMGDRNLRVKGTAHAHQAIANGSSTIVECSSCRAVLQVGMDAKLLYCINCEQVTPIESNPNMAGAVTSYTGRSCASDSDISISLQRQEIDVACARKLARLEE